MPPNTALQPDNGKLSCLLRSERPRQLAFIAELGRLGAIRTIRVVILVIAAAACGGGAADETMEVRVLSASYEFRGESYRSIAELESALSALPEQAVSVSTSTCADESRVVNVVRLLRERQANVGLSTFDESCQ